MTSKLFWVLRRYPQQVVFKYLLLALNLSQGYEMMVAEGPITIDDVPPNHAVLGAASMPPIHGRQIIEYYGRP